MPAGRSLQRNRDAAQIEWRGISIEISHVSRWCAVTGIDHIEVSSAGRVPLPITGTGYRSLFIYPEHFAAYGSAANYVRAWLDEAAQDDAWKREEQAARQLSLF